MAEISYPFTADSAGGGQQMMNQAQWQYLSRLGNKDRVDLRLVSTSYDSEELPFAATVVSTTSVRVGSGRAIVGGFYYQLTQSQTVPIASNTGTTSRIDLVILRLNMSTSSVNLAVKQGQPAAAPKAPTLTRDYGDVWEMALHQVTVPANSGALTILNVAAYDMPDRVEAPWDADTVAEFQQSGTFVYDMDVNNNYTQTEVFKGRDGIVPTRHLGRSRTYTPNLFNGKYTLDPAMRSGRWRWIAPDVVHVSMSFTAYEDQGLVVSGSNWYLGATLPQPANGQIRQVLTGFLSNPEAQGGTPNAAQVIAHTQANSSNLTLYTPNSTNLAQGLDGFRVLPPRSTLYISGTYESNRFGV
jgi:hypothetical protein